MKILQLFTLIITFSTMFPLTNAQTETNDMPPRILDQDEASHKIVGLKDGILLVKLTSDRRKIATLESQAAASPNDKKIKKKLEDAIAYREEFNKEWRASILNEYSFSEVMFFYDYDSKQLLENVKSGIFLDENFNIDPSLNIDNQFFLVLGEGTTEDSGMDAYIIYNSSMQPLNKPFPYYFRKNDFFRVVLSIFNSKAKRHRATDKIAKDIHEAFSKFYSRAAPM